MSQLLTAARARYVRLAPRDAAAAQAAGAVLVDIRGDDQIRVHGAIPGAVRVERNVLEWRADPECTACDPRIANCSAVLVIVCQQGFQSSLAAGNLHDLGLTRTTDLEGGFEAWLAEGLPVESATGQPIGGSARGARRGERDVHGRQWSQDRRVVTLVSDSTRVPRNGPIGDRT